MSEFSRTDSDGNTFWYKEDYAHRENGPAIEWVDGGEEYRYNGLIHRIDGPAVSYIDGHKEWWINNKRHREDGPAIEWANGFKSWYYNGEQFFCKNNEEFLRLIKLKILW